MIRRTPTGAKRSDGHSRIRLAGLAVLIGLLCVLGLPQGANATLELLKPSPTDPATFFGMGGYSADGLGQNGTGGTIQADVPAGSTVVQAYLYGTYNFNTAPDLTQRTIDLDATSVVLTTLPNSEAGNVGLSTARATVTSQVAAKVGSGGGITDFEVNSDPSTLDGVALVVLFSNPALPEVTVAILDGGSKPAGDTATFNFASPLDTTTPGFSAVMSLGSGYSYQGGTPGHGCGGSQFSTVDINGSPLTSCAGHWDDGVGNNDALITVGGVGDSIDNPASPTTQTGTDDELYDLVPFLQNGATSLTIQTANPSADDNLFLSIVAITAQAAVTTEVCNDGIDNDGDNLIDGADPDCAITPAQKATSTTYTGGSTVQYSDPITLSGQLLDTSVGPNVGVAGKTIDFTLGTQTASASPTDSNGDASTPLTVTQQPAVTTVATSFAGDANYLLSSDSDDFTITKEDCTVAYSAAGDTLVPPLANTNLAAQMGEPDATLGDLSGKTVTFTLTDSSAAVTTYTAVTNAAGAASTSVPLPSNVYGVVVSFAGDSFYQSCSSPLAPNDTLITVQAAGAKVTGGGWFTGSGTFRTNFGLNLIPEAGGLYKGQIQLRTNNGKGKFHGNTATGVVTLAANKVSWKGTGKWQGASGYTFEVTVVDNGSSGSKKGDTIALKVYETADPATVVYTSAGSRPLKGGNLTVR